MLRSQADPFEAFGGGPDLEVFDRQPEPESGVRHPPRLCEKHWRYETATPPTPKAPIWRFVAHGGRSGRESFRL